MHNTNYVNTLVYFLKFINNYQSKAIHQSDLDDDLCLICSQCLNKIIIFLHHDPAVYYRHILLTETQWNMPSLFRHRLKRAVCQ